MLVGAQFGLLQWKKRNEAQYKRWTLVGLWIVPPLLAAYQGWVRFLVTWVIAALACAKVYKSASQKPMASATPRRVYSFFLAVYRTTLVMGVGGYVVMMFFSFIPTAPGSSWSETGFLVACYGIYYGVLNRDLAEWCADVMNYSMGYTASAQDGLPSKSLDPDVCSICNGVLVTAFNLGMRPGDEDEMRGQDKTVQLSCRHRFHEFCVRGWSIVGKKDVCPYCKERVNFRDLFSNPWETQNLMWSNLLDFARYVIVWNPVLIGGFHLVVWSTGFE